MSEGIEIEGFEELEELLQEMTIDELDEAKAVRKAIDVIDKSLDGEIPIGKTKRLSKRNKSVKKEGMATVGTLKLTAFYDFMREFGTSQSKANAGFFERAVRNSENEAIEILAKELLDKIK